MVKQKNYNGIERYDYPALFLCSELLLFQLDIYSSLSSDTFGY